VIHLWPVLLLTAVLAGAGMYGVLARRNAVLVLIGVELLLNAGTLLLVAADAMFRDQLHSGQVLTIFVITLAAAEIGVALAVVLLLFRTRGDIDLSAATSLGESADRAEVGP
jgi:NADH-quinone oxidoreductase subunit K